MECDVPANAYAQAWFERARTNAPAAHFIIADMRGLSALRGPFDAAVCLWQSFGYFNSDTNAAVLRDIAGLLRPGGRLVLDVYHRGFFERHDGERTLEVDGRSVTERRRLEGERLMVRLSYDDAGADDEFTWQLFMPDELIALASSTGLSAVIACSGFDEAAPASDQVPRYQLILQRSAYDG